MPSYVVAYDLQKQGQNYECLIERIKKYGTHWHMQQSVWIVVTEDTSSQIRDYLKPCLDSNDKLFVAKMSGEAAWYGYSDQITQWLKKYL